MKIQYLMVLLLAISSLSCTNEDKTQREKQSKDTKLSVKQKNIVEDSLTFYDKARARMKAKKEVERKEYWRKYLQERESFANSNYILSQGKIRRVDSGLASNGEEKENFELIQKTYQRIRSSRDIPQGTKITVFRTENEYIVTFDKALTKEFRGSTLIAKITIDVITDDIISFEVGG